MQGTPESVSQFLMRIWNSVYSESVMEGEEVKIYFRLYSDSNVATLLITVEAANGINIKLLIPKDK